MAKLEIAPLHAIELSTAAAADTTATSTTGPSASHVTAPTPLAPTPDGSAPHGHREVSFKHHYDPNPLFEAKTVVTCDARRPT